MLLTGFYYIENKTEFKFQYSKKLVFHLYFVIRLVLILEIRIRFSDSTKYKSYISFYRLETYSITITFFSDDDTDSKFIYYSKFKILN